ncbi:hypothetical protein DAEQUDRAFT_145910 [Daedalea quercina L-15889]|uniref:Uncharacterized protein n=1 Tax=Daedalea quercina L-15889 TaxID=1314783 RepID=A0A165KNU6_9APHY|nr:hypothetical protein DAEQUDRAFT_145910 [Daedalea quercina L-15889]
MAAIRSRWHWHRSNDLADVVTSVRLLPRAGTIVGTTLFIPSARAKDRLVVWDVSPAICSSLTLYTRQSYHCWSGPVSDAACECAEKLRVPLCRRRPVCVSRGATFAELCVIGKVVPKRCTSLALGCVDARARTWVRMMTG